MMVYFDDNEVQGEPTSPRSDTNTFSDNKSLGSGRKKPKRNLITNKYEALCFAYGMLTGLALVAIPICLYIIFHKW